MTGSTRWIEFVPAGDTSSPSFWWAAARFREGYKRFQRLQAMIEEVAAGWNDHPFVRATRASAATGEPFVELGGTLGFRVEQKREASTLASEFLFHIRSSLDHAVYQAAWQDSGTRQSGTAFSICKSRKAWRDRVKKDLVGLSSDHLKAFEAEQPYNDIEWTLILGQLSNRDKHRTSVEATPSYAFKVDFGKQYDDPFGDPLYYGYEVEDPEIKCRLIPVEHDGEGSSRIEAREALSKILLGSARLLNVFLEEAGESPLVVTLNNDESD